MNCPGKDILNVRLIGDDQTIRMTTAERNVVNGDEIVGILRCDELDERIFSGIIAIGGQLAAFSGR